jgi:type IV secretory pathway VirB2 component (pilin)
LLTVKSSQPNIGPTGRWLRAAVGIVLLGVAWWAVGQDRRLAALLAVLGVFCLYEAARGWCLLRACGIKTKW